MPRSRKPNRPAAPKPKLPAQLRRDSGQRLSAQSRFARPAARKAPPTRRSGGHRG